MAEREERRRSRRFDWSWPITVGSSDRELAQGRTANISRSGAYFHSHGPAPLSPGMVVDVRINIPPVTGMTKPIHGRARVVRLEENPGTSGVALHFTEELDTLPETSIEPELI